MSKQFSASEVAAHNSADDCWIIIDNKVYDVTKFLKFHPGGKNVILRYAGQDATADFHMLHSDLIQKKYARFIVGTLRGASDPDEKAMVWKSKLDQKTFYGDQVPYGDANWYQGYNNPFYKDTHRRFRHAIRAFVDKEIIPYVDQWDQAKKMPPNVYRKAYEAGWLPAVIGNPWPTEYAGTKIAGGVKPEEFDYFHEQILIEEIGRAGSGGVLWGFFAGLSIGLPPIMLFGSDYLKKRIVKDCIMGEKFICLAITEPWAGSDVANLRTEAKKTADGKHYIVNGEKKWITNGVFCDYFTVAVRTGGRGMGGISLLLVEKTFPGVTTKQMKCQGVWPSGTTYITFEDVKVPVENLIGKENQGFKCIMYNFNHERWGTCVQANRFARVCVEESFKWATRRKTFGKCLIEHPVIREKLAEMVRQVEASQSWLDVITHQLNTMSHRQAMTVLAGPIALLKVQCTKTFEFCAREAIQIFGGTGYTMGNLGSKVERLYREVRAYAIPAGSEEIMRDLGIRQAMKSPYIAQRMAKL
jgi:alkylation response protein AidB-like acyl-CoA dehydrogenase